MAAGQGSPQSTPGENFISFYSCAAVQATASTGYVPRNAAARLDSYVLYCCTSSGASKLRRRNDDDASAQAALPLTDRLLPWPQPHVGRGGQASLSPLSASCTSCLPAAINSRSRTDQLVGRDWNLDRSPPPVRAVRLVGPIMGARDWRLPPGLATCDCEAGLRACRAHIRRGDAIHHCWLWRRCQLSIRWGETGREFVAALVAFIQAQSNAKWRRAGRQGVFLRCWLLSNPLLAGERKVQALALCSPYLLPVGSSHPYTFSLHFFFEPDE
jgi:hypothetical protein